MLRDGVVAATEWPYCVCDSCGGESRGKPPEGGATDTVVDPINHRCHFYDRVFRDERRRLRAIRDYYDTHDTSREMEHGHWEND
jgi:hypothetical protein